MQRSNNAVKDTSLHCRALPFNEDACVSAPQPEAPQRPRLENTPLDLSRLRSPREALSTPPRRSRGRHIPSPPPATCGVEYEVCRVTFKAHRRSHSSRAHTSAATSHRAQAELIASKIQTHGRLLLSPLTALGVTAERACTAAAVEKLTRVKNAAGWNKLCCSKFSKHPGRNATHRVHEMPQKTDSKFVEHQKTVPNFAH